MEAFRMHIFVINLFRAKERKELMERQLKYIGFQYTIFNAIDAMNFVDGDVERFADSKKIKIKYNRMLSRGEIACAASHRSVYAQILAQSISRAIVLEDDVILANNFSRVVGLLDDLRIQNLLIKIDTFSQKDTTKTLRHRMKICDGYLMTKPVFGQCDARGYYIDSLAARNLLNESERVSRLADDWGAVRGIVRVRSIFPCLVEDNLGLASQLEEERSGKSNEKDKKKRFLTRAWIHLFFLIDKYFRLLFT
jgi:glycosyl transferase, family 25